MNDNEFTLGEICAGISGFGIGFEQAGWRTKWQIEIDEINRAVLADRCPHASQWPDLRRWRSYSLPAVACIAAGFPCQDISNMGATRRDQSQRGLGGHKSGLFFEIMEIVRFLQPAWLVLENVPALLHVNHCRDIQTVLSTIAECGYCGFFRVLNAQYFRIPQNRRRLLLVFGLGKFPSTEFLADSGAVDAIPASAGSNWLAKDADDWAGYTLMAPDKHRQCSSRINLGTELLVAEENGWDQMVERAGEIEAAGISCGLDATNLAEAYAAGNAFPPPMAKWIAEILKRS